MDFTVETILIVGSFLLFVSILASKLSARLGIPTLLIFLTIGMLAGSEGIGGIGLHNPMLAKVLGTITIALILFAGGIDTEYTHIRPIIWHSISLSTIGVVVTAFVTGYFIYWITDLSLVEGLLVGAIISSTDAAAVFSILRSKNLHLKHHLAPTLELESGSNDVMAYFLMIFFTRLLSNYENTEIINVVPVFFQEMLIGGAIGFLAGKLMVLAVNKTKLAYESLYPGLTLSMILFTYAITNFIHGSGFLAVYIAALILGSQDFLHKKSLIRFYDSLTWLMQVAMFIVLGLLVFPKQLTPIAGMSFLVALVLMFVARPLSVFLALSFFKKIDYRQKLFISWVGLRGAVPIVFATYPWLAGVNKSDIIFHIIFFIVMASVLLQGTTLHPFAKWLRLDDPLAAKRAENVSLSEAVKNALIELEITQDSVAVGKCVVELHLPKSALIVLIHREESYLKPRGDTKIVVGDRLMIMTDDKRTIKDVKLCLGIIPNSST